MSKLYEGPAGDFGSTKASPSSSATMNGEPDLEKRSPTKNGVPEVTFDEASVLPGPTKG